MTDDICNIVQVGHKGITKTGERFVILEYVKKKGYKIKFLDEYGAEIIRNQDMVKKGGVRNPYEISVCGVGRIGVCTYSYKERDFWRRVIEKYSKGKLPRLNPRWLVLEYWLEDTRKLRDYDIFLTRKGHTLFDPFMRYDNIDHIIVSENATYTRGVVVKDLFSGDYEVYSSRFECAYETGYNHDTIFEFCRDKAIRDGYQYHWASDYAELYFD